jgi:hypothetical protein
MDSSDARATLVDAIRLDLIGPRPDAPAHAKYAEERLPTTPSIWYPTGFLAPAAATANTPVSDVDEGETPEAADRLGVDDDAPPWSSSLPRARASTTSTA